MGFKELAEARLADLQTANQRIGSLQYQLAELEDQLATNASNSSNASLEEQLKALRKELELKDLQLSASKDADNVAQQTLDKLRTTESQLQEEQKKVKKSENRIKGLEDAQKNAQQNRSSDQCTTEREKDLNTKNQKLNTRLSDVEAAKARLEGTVQHLQTQVQNLTDQVTRKENDDDSAEEIARLNVLLLQVQRQLQAEKKANLSNDPLMATAAGKALVDPDDEEVIERCVIQQAAMLLLH